VPEPRIEPAPPAAQRPVPSRQASPAGPVSFGGLPAGFLSDAPKDIESMKRDARILMAAFAKGGSRPGSALTTVPKAGDPVAMVDAAVRQAFAQSGIKGSGVRR